MVSNSSLTHWFRWSHDDVIKWKYFPRNWPFVWGIHRSPVNSPHKGQGRGALMFALIWGWINGWVNKREAGDLRRHRAHSYVIVMVIHCLSCPIFLMNVPDAFTVKEVWQHHHPPHSVFMVDHLNAFYYKIYRCDLPYHEIWWYVKGIHKTNLRRVISKSRNVNVCDMTPSVTGME